MSSGDSAPACACDPAKPAHRGGDPKTHNLGWSRVAAASAATDEALSRLAGMTPAKIASSSVRVKEICTFHSLADSFVVLHGIGVENRLLVSLNGVRRHSPIDVDISYELGALRAKTADDVFYIHVESRHPARFSVRIPVRLVDAIRDPETGHVIRARSVEIVPLDLSDEDVKLIECILACGGFALAICVALCLYTLPVWPAFLACIAACMAEQAAEIMECIEACHMALPPGPT
jgi:hypothetical protein